MLRVELQRSINVGEFLRASRSNPVGSCRVVGKEDWSGRILLFWLETIRDDDCSDNQVEGGATAGSDCPGRVAHVGLLDPQTTAIEVIFRCGNYLDIVQCTVDREVQHLAFVNQTIPPARGSPKEENAGRDGHCDASEVGCSSYMCYWTRLCRERAECRDIRPLNKDSCDYIKVQFLSANQLLMFIAREAIYLYTLPADQDFLGNVTPPPVLYERLAAHFLWAQWDVVAGHLFYLLFRPKPGVSLTRWAHPQADKNGRLPDDPDSPRKHRPVLVGMQFHTGSAAETVLNTPLELLTPASPETSDRHPERPTHLYTEESRGPLRNQIQDAEFHEEMAVFAKPEGTVFICQATTNDAAENAIKNDEEMDMKYSVTAVHHANTVVCHIRGRPLSPIAADSRITFFPIRDSLVVALPGVFCHLLDLGLMHEPGNHVLFPGCSLPPAEDEEGCRAEFYFCGAEPFASYVCYGPDRIRFYSVDVTADSLLDAFLGVCQRHRHSSFSSVRQCILHYLLVHLQDFSAVEKVLFELIGDPTDPQLVKLFQEFLIGGSFAHTHNSAESKFVSLIPASLSEPLQPQQDSTPDGGFRVVIGYAALKDASSVLLAPTERHLPHRRPTDLWCRLWSLLQSSGTPSTSTAPRRRFSPRSMHGRLLALGSPRVPTAAQQIPASPFVFPSGEDVGDWRPSTSHLFSNSYDAAASFCHRFLGAAAGVRRTLVGSSTGRSGEADSQMPRSLETSDDDCSQLEQIAYWNLREITVHMSKIMPGEKSSEINDVTCCYVANQLHHSQVLCHYLFRCLDLMPLLQGNDFHPYAFLNGLNPGNATLLFSLLERYLVAIKEVVFPLPQGFEAFFSVLAYKCLDISTFLQYVDFGVTRLDSEVLHCIAVDVAGKDDCLQKDDVILEIAWRLPRWRTAYFLEHLKHPTNSLLQVHNIVSKRLEQLLNRAGSKKSDGSDRGNVTTSHQPRSRVDVSKGAGAGEVEAGGDTATFDPASPSSLPSNLSYLISSAMDSFMYWLQEGDGGLPRNKSFSSLASPLSPSPSSSSSRICPPPSAASSSANDDVNQLSLVRERQMNNLIGETFRDGVRPPPHFWR